MSAHDQSQLGAYALGALDAAEAQAVRNHLAGCADCRDEVAALEEMKQFLGEVPPEAFLDGPPPDGDLLLQRTLREVRAVERVERAPARPARSRWLTAAAVVVIAAAGVGAGVVVGTGLDESDAPPAAVAGTRERTVTDATTGATMATKVEPRNGWSWVDVKISGLRMGYPCEVRVTDKAGKTYVAGSWLISDKAAREGAGFSGGVAVPVGEVKSVELVTLSGKRMALTTL
jgi:anti-sigma factor RsiW